MAWRRGTLGGLEVDWRLMRNTSGAFSLLWTEEGATHTVTTPSFPFGDMRLTYRFDYVTLPLFIQTAWFALGPLCFSTQGGVFLAREVRNRYVFSNKQKGTAGHGLRDVSRVDFGFVSGAALGLYKGRLSFLLSYRYAMGFVDLRLDTDPLTIPEFRGVEFPVIQLRNFYHAILVSVKLAP